MSINYDAKFVLYLTGIVFKEEGNNTAGMWNFVSNKRSATCETDTEVEDKGSLAVTTAAREGYEVSSIKEGRDKGFFFRRSDREEGWKGP